MKTHIMILAAALGGSVALAAAAEPAPAPADSRVSVTFIDPGHFTDFKQDDNDTSSQFLVDQLREFIATTGGRYVPAGMNLEIKVTDVDLAGSFEPWRGPEFARIRVVKSIYPPRIKLQFKLTDARGQTVSSGDRSLTDLAFQMRDPFLQPSDDYLRYEKDLLRDWFRTEFKPLTVAGN